jgi:hypothetical protein
VRQTGSKASELDARVRSGEAAWAHIEAEVADVVDEIMATLVPEEPYAYTVAKAASFFLPTTGAPIAAGSIPYQEFVSSKADLRASYEDLHRSTAVRPMAAVAEIRGDWYAFAYGATAGVIKATGQSVSGPTAVLFPTMGKNGITGELLWSRTGVGPPYTAGREGPLAAEIAIVERHEALLAALRSGDAGTVAGLFHPDAQIGIRDYMNDTGELVELHSAEALRRYLERFFARFEVQAISLIHRLATDWFVFAELLWIVEHKEQPGQRDAFYTAEHAEVRPDGLFASRIGHGTDRRKL